jgi:hypothetical protein
MAVVAAEGPQLVQLVAQVVVESVGRGQGHVPGVGIGAQVLLGELGEADGWKLSRPGFDALAGCLRRRLEPPQAVMQFSTSTSSVARQTSVTRRTWYGRSFFVVGCMMANYTLGKPRSDQRCRGLTRWSGVIVHVTMTPVPFLCAPLQLRDRTTGIGRTRAKTQQLAATPVRAPTRFGKSSTPSKKVHRASSYPPFESLGRAFHNPKLLLRQPVELEDQPFDLPASRDDLASTS